MAGNSAIDILSNYNVLYYVRNGLKRLRAMTKKKVNETKCEIVFSSVKSLIFHQIRRFGSEQTKSLGNDE